MQYIRATNGVIEHPFNLSTIRDENPNVSFPREMTNELLAEYGVFPVIATDPPAVQPHEKAVEDVPALINDTWMQRWKVVKRSPPSKITPRQCRIMLAQNGILSQVEAAVAAMDEATRITWEYAIEFRRDDPLLLAVAEGLGITSEQLDAMFIAAAAI